MGNGGTRLHHTTRENIGTPRIRFMSKLPTAQLKAPERARARANAGRSAPTVRPTSNNPSAAKIIPATWRALGRSPSNRTASSTVRKTWVCCVTEARPGGIPCRKAKKSNRNCPANSVDPIANNMRHGTPGRAMKKTGVAAIKNRNAVSCDAVKPSRPKRVATNASPQTIEVKAAKAVSRGVIRPFRQNYSEGSMKYSIRRRACPIPLRTRRIK